MKDLSKTRKILLETIVIFVFQGILLLKFKIIAGPGTSILLFMSFSNLPGFKTVHVVVYDNNTHLFFLGQRIILTKKTKART